MKVQISKRKRAPYVAHYQIKPKYDYLKYMRVAKKWVKSKYKISQPDLEILLFLYSEGLFKKTDFNNYSNIFSFDKNRFTRLLDDGWIHMWAKKTSGNNQYYEVSHKCKTMITSFYKKLMGLETYSTDPLYNPMFSKTATYSDKVYANQIKRINEYVKT